MSLDISNIGSVEAARYLQLDYNTFINYVNRGLIVYSFSYPGITNNTERFFTRKELHRFKIEVLDTKAKL